MMATSGGGASSVDGDGTFSLSYDVGLQALSAMLGRQLKAFHQVRMCMYV
jgi:hypothetical protein